MTPEEQNKLQESSAPLAPQTVNTGTSEPVAPQQVATTSSAPLAPQTVNTGTSEPVAPQQVATTSSAPLAPQTANTDTPEPVAPQQVATTSSAPLAPQTAKPATPLAPKVQVKKKIGSKISPLQFAIGCGLFGILLIGGVGIGLYFALQNPEQFKGIIGIEGIKTGLKLFAGLFFGFLFLAGFILSVFNIFKLISKKTRSKFKYIVGLIIGIIFVGGSVGAGIISFNKINELIETTDSSDIITAYVPFKSGYRPTTDGYVLIAPLTMKFNINTTLLQRFIASNFTNNNKSVVALALDCGNETQILPYNPNPQAGDTNIMGQCLYMQKGRYPISVVFTISDKATAVQSKTASPWKDIVVMSEITLSPSQGSLSFNDDGDEIIIGQAPVKLELDSTKIFTDFKMSDYKINRDFDGDGERDDSDRTLVTHQFREGKKQSIYFNLPGYNANLVYRIDLRVLQSDVPICTINLTQDTRNPSSYRIQTSFDDERVAINSYMYKIKNLETGKIIDSIITRQDQASYEFIKKGNYSIELEYKTNDNKSGFCESDTINVGDSDLTVNYSLYYRFADTESWKPLSATSDKAQFDGEKITTTTVPVFVRLVLEEIFPQTLTTSVVVKLDKQIIQSANNKQYDIRIQDNTSQEIILEANDPEQVLSTTVRIPIIINQDDIIGRLEIFPDSAGSSPFEVTLDASTTTLTDNTDSIELFTRDFGDGDIVKNDTKSRVQHTYIYNTTTQNGIYRPTVTITTKKGKTQTFGLQNPIIVSKTIMSATVSIDSHPAQIASIGDRVEFSVHTDGTPTHIVWDFGNGESYECNDRSCASIPMTYKTSGNYRISATISYKDGNTTVTDPILLVIKK